MEFNNNVCITSIYLRNDGGIQIYMQILLYLILLDIQNYAFLLLIWSIITYAFLLWCFNRTVHAIIQTMMWNDNILDALKTFIFTIVFAVTSLGAAIIYFMNAYTHKTFCALATILTRESMCIYMYGLPGWHFTSAL